MSEKKKDKTCFVISPIGEEGTETRNRSDKVLKFIIKPAALECGYLAVRADEIDQPGMITSQIINRVVEADLVIADLSEMNPNVFYELAIRHAISKPLVQIIKKGDRIPFDVAQTRTIHVDHQDLESADQARKDIVKQIVEVEKNPEKMDTPISISLEIQSLKKSSNPEDVKFAEIIDIVGGLEASIGKLDSRVMSKSDGDKIIEIIQTIRTSYSDELTKKRYRSKIINSKMISMLRHSSLRGRDKFYAPLSAMYLFYPLKDFVPGLYEASSMLFSAYAGGNKKEIAKAVVALRATLEFFTRNAMILEEFGSGEVRYHLDDLMMVVHELEGMIAMEEENAILE